MGGDSRLLIPSNQNVVTAEEQIGGQVRIYKYSIPRITIQVHFMQFVSLIAGGADLHVYEIPIRDDHQKWVSNQKEEPSSGSHCKGHSILLCGKVSYLSSTYLTFAA